MDCHTSYAGCFGNKDETTVSFRPTLSFCGDKTFPLQLTRPQQFRPQSELSMPSGEIQWGSVSRETYTHADGAERTRPIPRPRGELETVGGSMEFQPVTQSDYKPPGTVQKASAVRPANDQVRIGDPAVVPPAFSTSYTSDFGAKQVGRSERGKKAPEQHRISNVSFNGE